MCVRGPEFENLSTGLDLDALLRFCFISLSGSAHRQTISCGIALSYHHPPTGCPQAGCMSLTVGVVHGGSVADALRGGFATAQLGAVCSALRQCPESLPASWGSYTHTFSHTSR